MRCEKADAVVGVIFAVIFLFLVPFLVYLCIRSCKRRRGARGNRHEEDGMEMTRRVLYCDPGPQTNREVSDGASNFDLHIGSSQGSLAATKEHSQARSLRSSPGRQSPPAYEPPKRMVSRGREFIRGEHSRRRRTRSLSTVRIRVAMLGKSMKDPTIIDVPPSSASSKRNSMWISSSSDVDNSSDCNPHDDETQHCSKYEGCECVDESGEDGDRRDDERRSRSSSRRSTSRISEQQNEEEGRPDDAGSRCSSRRSSSSGPYDQPENDVDKPDGHSISRPSSPASSHQEED